MDEYILEVPQHITDAYMLDEEDEWWSTIIGPPEFQTRWSDAEIQPSLSDAEIQPPMSDVRQLFPGLFSEDISPLERRRLFQDFDHMYAPPIHTCIQEDEGNIIPPFEFDIQEHDHPDIIQTCNVCLEEKSNEQFGKYNCGHDFCNTCTRQIVSAAYNNHKASICCPLCRETVTQVTIDSIQFYYKPDIYILY